MGYKLLTDGITGCTVIPECSQYSIGCEIDKQSLTFSGTTGRVVLEAIFCVAKVMTLFVDIIFRHFVVLG